MKVKINLGDFHTGKTGEKIETVPDDFFSWEYSILHDYLFKLVGKWRSVSKLNLIKKQYERKI